MHCSVEFPCRCLCSAERRTSFIKGWTESSDPLQSFGLGNEVHMSKKPGVSVPRTAVIVSFGK